MQLVAKLDSLLWVPYSCFTNAEATDLMKRLTVTPKRFNKTAPAPQPIKMYAKRPAERMVGLPIDYGMEWLGTRFEFEDNRVNGCIIEPTRFPDPNHPNAAPGQAQFMSDMLAAAKLELPFLAKAPTGSGKTVAALNTIGRIGSTALIIVGSRRLAKQWRQEAVMHLGLPERDIGLVQEGEADWEDTAITVAVVHNLAEGQWSPQFYQYWGIVVWDEAHRLGARMFARTLKQFPARWKWAMTATPRRRDGCEKLFLTYFGHPTVISMADALPTDAYVLDYRKQGKLYSSKIPLAVLLNLLAKDQERNRLIAHATRTLYDKDRQILVVSDRVAHLQGLRDLVISEGVPADCCGLFTRTYKDSEGRDRTHTEEELDSVTANAQVIFATYGMFKEGIDIPRLDAGIDATPRAEGTQVIGRVRRPLPDKKRPVWFTIKDLGVPQLLRQCAARLRDYREVNVEVHDGKTQVGEN